VTGLSNRAADNWAPLFAIADLAGGDWPELVRDAQRKLQQAREPVVSTDVELLVAIKRIFQKKKLDRISSATLVNALCHDPEANWSTYYRGQPITQKHIAHKLGEYGITPKSVRLGPHDTPKGYELRQFQDAFARYVPSPVENDDLSATPPQSNNQVAVAVADREPVVEGTSTSVQNLAPTSSHLRI